MTHIVDTTGMVDIISPYELAASLHPDIRVMHDRDEDGKFIGFRLPNGESVWFGGSALTTDSSVAAVRRELTYQLSIQPKIKKR